MEPIRWERLEEERRYRGATEGDVAALFRDQLNDALAAGYVPTSLSWSREAAEQVLTVTYEYDPDRAPRPL